MKIFRLIGVVGIASAGVLYTATNVQANPATPIPVIEASAATFCNAVNANPTAEGVLTGIEQAGLPGMDQMDGAYVLITAIHHTCAQHEQLVMDVIGEFAFPEGCKEQV